MSTTTDVKGDGRRANNPACVVSFLDEICFHFVSWMNILHLVSAKKEESAQIQKLKAQCNETAACPVSFPKDELKERLTPVQYRCTQEKGTERPFSGQYNSHNEEGSYRCVVCGNRIFVSDDKFKTHCGWPAFKDVVSHDKVKLSDDTSNGARRVEVQCADCKAHLGHVFDDGPKPSGIRYCINSASLDFKKETTV